MEFDWVIANGSVVDGSGRPRFRADVGVQAGKVAAVSTGEPLTGARTLDASGMVVAPGFIDVHTHFDWNLPQANHDQLLAPILLQGVTTLLTGNCGSSPAPVTEVSVPILNRRLSFYGVPAECEAQEPFPFFRWRSVSEYLDTLDRDGVLMNTAFLVGHGAIRYAVMGCRPSDPTPEELNELVGLVRQALREGAFGLSTGLGYEPGMYAGPDELLALLRPVHESDGLYTTHSRTYGITSPFFPQDSPVPANVLSIQEQLGLARQSGVRLQLSHLIFVGRRTWPSYRMALDRVEQAQADGLDVAFVAFPYTFGNTTIDVNFPKWFLVGREDNINDPDSLGRLEGEMTARKEELGLGFQDIILMHSAVPELAVLEGLDFSEIARRLERTEFEVYLHVARESRGAARILQDTYSGDSQHEEPLRAVLSHPLCSFMTDTLIFEHGYPNRATYGTFPRLLGLYSRDLGLFSLEEAVRRMTSLSAQRLGLDDIGQVAEGVWADLVVFDPHTVADHTTPERPDAPPTGIQTVFLSGHPVVQDGKIVDRQRRGRVLRR